MAQVLEEPLQPYPSPGGARVLHHQRNVSEIPRGGGSGLFRGQPGGLRFFGFLLQVEPQFFAEFRFLVVSLSHPAQLAENLVHTGSRLSGSNTSPMAREKVSHFVRSACNCFRPPAVRR